MGAACSVGGNASLQEPLKAGPRFQLPSGPTVANPPRRIADASDAGVTLGFLQQFFKQVQEVHFSDYPEFTTADVVSAEIRPSTEGFDCSYAELSAVPRAFVRPPKRFLSHAWERPFHELVEHLMATEKVAAARQVGSGVGEDEWLQVPVWIDIFALNQHVTQREQEDLFVVRGAMFQSDRLLLSLDQYGAALGRMWCVFEIWTAAQMLTHRGTQVAYEKNADVAVQLMVPRRAQWAPLRAGVELIDIERLKLSVEHDATLMKELFLLAANAARGGRDASPADNDTFANVHKLVRQTLFDGAPELVNDKLVEGWEVQMMSDPLVLMERGAELLAQQRYDTAEAIYRRLVTVREQACGPDAEAVCPDLMALGEVLTLRGKHQEAALRLRRCYQILEVLHGPHDVRLLDAASVLADALITTQRWSEAAPLLKQCLTLIDAAVGADNVAAAAVVEKMGGVQRAVGKLPEAEALLRRAVAMREAAQGDAHLALRPPLRQLMEVLAAADKLEAAVQVGRRCLDIAEAGLGPKHVEVAQELSELGSLLRQTNDLAGADAALSRCLHIREMAQGRTHEDVAQTLNSLAGVLSQMGDERAAEVTPLYKRAIGIYERAAENRQRELARTVNNLGVFLKQQGELTMAEEMYRRTLAIHEKELGPDHVEVAEDLSNLGTLMREMGRLPAAVELLRRALLLNRAALGATHPTVALDLDALGAVLQEQGQLREAESYYAKALEITDLDTPATRPLAVRRMQVLATVQIDQSRWLEASVNLKHAANALQEMFTASHPHTLAALELWAKTLEADGSKLGDAAAVWLRIKTTEVEPFASSAKERMMNLERRMLTDKRSGRLALPKPSELPPPSQHEDAGFPYTSLAAETTEPSVPAEPTEQEAAGRGVGSTQVAARSEDDTAASSASQAVVQQETKRGDGAGSGGEAEGEAEDEGEEGEGEGREEGATATHASAADADASTTPMPADAESSCEAPYADAPEQQPSPAAPKGACIAQGLRLCTEGAVAFRRHNMTGAGGLPSGISSFAAFLTSNGLDPHLLDQLPPLPRYLRLNPRMDDTDLAAVEVQVGTKLTPVPWLDGFYSLPDSVGIAGCDAYKQGRLYGVDAASGAAVMALAPRPGEHVLDLCAAPGAKLCMMADMLAGSGSVTGVDIARPRLATCRSLLTKYHVPNCRLFLCDGRTFAAPPPSQSPQRTQTAVGCKEASGGGAAEDAGPTPSCATPGPSSCFPRHGAVAGTSETGTQRKDQDHTHQVGTSGGCTRANGDPSPQARTPCGRGRASKRRRRRCAPPEAELTDAQPFFASTPSSHTDGGAEAGSGDAAGLYDCVMVDAECTHDGSVKHLTKYDQWGWDTFERRFLDPQRISTITELQRALLTNGLRLVRPGGRVVYSTCSLTRSQNEEVVAAVVAASGGAVELVACDVAVNWPCVPGGIPHSLRFDPRTSGTSGLFISCLRRL